MSLASWSWISSLNHHLCPCDFINQKEIQELGGTNFKGVGLFVLSKKACGFVFGCQEFDLELEKLYSKATHVCWGNLFWCGEHWWISGAVEEPKGYQTNRP